MDIVCIKKYKDLKENGSDAVVFVMTLFNSVNAAVKLLVLAYASAFIKVISPGR